MTFKMNKYISFLFSFNEFRKFVLFSLIQTLFPNVNIQNKEQDNEKLAVDKLKKKEVKFHSAFEATMKIFPALNLIKRTQNVKRVISPQALKQEKKRFSSVSTSRMFMLPTK